ncbi:MAG: TetR family transcriptional regulator [Aquificales bacterium]|nr:TetR family transcriptional regulator [Aquificales bacterium]
MTEQDARDQILMTATAVFAEKGFAKTSMNDIVRASGLSKGGVYWHFKSKNELIAAIFDMFFAGQEAIMNTVLDGAGSATERLLQMAQLAGSDLEAAFAQFPAPMEFYALASRDDELRVRLRAYYQVYLDKYSQLIQQGVDSGEWKPVSAQETAVTIISLMEGVILLWNIYPEDVDMGSQMETAVQLMLDGLAKINDDA